MSLAETRAERTTFGPVALAPTTWYGRWGKRCLDVIGAAALLLVLLPVLVVVLLGVRLVLGRGVFYQQQRVGRGGRPFAMKKVRTMLADRRRAELGIAFPDRRRSHKRVDDPRHTRLGRLLRRTSLDELPQLLNVLRGDMSLVGPRPELVDVACRGGLVDHPRHQVRPGITGPWQTSALRRSARISDGLALDLAYVEQMSLRRDLAILGRTAAAVLRGTGS